MPDDSIDRALGRLEGLVSAQQKTLELAQANQADTLNRIDQKTDSLRIDLATLKADHDKTVQTLAAVKQWQDRFDSKRQLRWGHIWSLVVPTWAVIAGGVWKIGDWIHSKP